MAYKLVVSGGFYEDFFHFQNFFWLDPDKNESDKNISFDLLSTFKRLK